MRKLVSASRTRQIVFILLLIFVAWPVQSAERGPLGTIRVGVFPFEPLNFVDQQGVAQGLYPDLLRKIVKDEKWTVEFVPGSWAEGLERLQKGEIDLILSVAYSRERAEIMDFTYESVAELWGQVFIRPEGKSKNIHDLQGHRVAVMRKDISGSNFIMTAEKLGVSCEIVEYSTHAEVFTAVRKGETDAGVAPQHFGLRHTKEYNLIGSSIIFSPFSIFFAGKKGAQHELLSHIDAHLSKWKKDPDSFYFNRLNFWLGSRGPAAIIPAWLIYTAIIGALAILLFAGFTVLLKRTVRIRTEELRESEVTFRKLFADSSDAILLIDNTGVFVECNQSALDLLKMTRDQFLLLPPARISPEFQPDGRRSAEAAPEMIALAYSKGLHRFDWTCVNSEGGEFIVEVSLMPVTIKGQIMLHTTWRDITKRKQAEEALRESEQFLNILLESLPIPVFYKNVEGRYKGCNDAFETFFGRSRLDLIGKSVFDINPLELAKTYHAKDSELFEKVSTQMYESQVKNAYGELRNVVFHKATLTNASGAISGLVGAIMDITEQKRQEEEKIQLENKLHQSQKMEAVGQLAGGVAHDFNNMLGVIIGYSEMILEQVGPSQQFHAELEEIQKAARRSADLTRQLLTFARKQTVTPKVLDLNQTIEGMLKMLRRLIGENIDLIWMPGSGLWPINMDPSQIDQILANLCVNARDAIGGVGKLTVETKNATFDKEYCATHAGALPGEYVRITVSDTGSGMDKKTLAHIFEPFFTTKDVGEGTGLGLATVYGAVKQNNGFINAYSEPGQGTTLTIYIPRHVETIAETRATASTEPVVRGDEIVMLVEDEPTILQMSKIMLERLGYSVLAAGTPGEAMRLAGAYSGQIHLLATDVIMPEMNGRELSARLLESRPGIKCLFMSGYTANIIANQGVLEEGVSFIQKPFSKNELAAKVREALES